MEVYPKHTSDHMDEPQTHILLADDDDQYAFILQIAFKQAGIESAVDVVTSHEQFLSYLSGVDQYAHRAGHPPLAVIILGLRLPFEDGFQTLRWVRQRPELNHVPIMVLSGIEHNDERETALQLGADCYEVKPCRFDESVRIAEKIRHCWIEPHDLRLAA